jgi:hypothetical protein
MSQASSVPRQVPIGVPTNNNKTPSFNVNIDTPKLVRFGTLAGPTVHPEKLNFIQTKDLRVGNMFRQIGTYTNNDMIMPSCIEITKKMKLPLSGQGLTYNQSTPIHVPQPRQKGIFDSKISIGNIGWDPEQKPLYIKV